MKMFVPCIYDAVKIPMNNSLSIFTSDFPVPETHFKLTYRTDFDGMVHIKCSAFNVFPEPKLSLKYVELVHKLMST